MPPPSYYTPTPPSLAPETITTDVCIYGGTSGGIIAAITAKRLGHSVILLAFSDRLGGMTASGLGQTDIGNKAAIGGLALDFYREVGRRYGNPIAWTFEPHVAEQVFIDLVKEYGITVHYHQHLTGVVKDGNYISEIAMGDGNRYRAKIFIDAGYEGDLLARAGVSYHVGREATSVYGEIFNGIHFGHPNHNFYRFVDPYKIAGDPGSGVLPGITDEPAGIQGQGDHRIQAYNFRLCLTKRDDIKIAFSEPQGYDPERYTLLARYLDAGIWDALTLSGVMPNGKTDTNNWGAFSTDNVGMNHEWPEGSYQRREEIYQEHVQYIQGLLWFLSHDERVPVSVREETREWGLPSDEFISTGAWPHELYIREARRMVSDYVMTEHNCVGRIKALDPVGLGAYGMDSHNCRRVVLGGRAYNEGNVEIGNLRPYPVSYRSIVPRESECANLFVPFAISASHIAFGSIRMEPMFMVLSQSAATAAHLAIKNSAPVQRVHYPTLQERLVADGQVLAWTDNSLVSGVWKPKKQ